MVHPYLHTARTTNSDTLFPLVPPLPPSLPSVVRRRAAPYTFPSLNINNGASTSSSTATAPVMLGSRDAIVLDTDDEENHVSGSSGSRATHSQHMAPATIGHIEPIDLSQPSTSRNIWGIGAQISPNRTAPPTSPGSPHSVASSHESDVIMTGFQRAWEQRSPIALSSDEEVGQGETVNLDSTNESARGAASGTRRSDALGDIVSGLRENRKEKRRRRHEEGRERHASTSSEDDALFATAASLSRSLRHECDETERRRKQKHGKRSRSPSGSHQGDESSRSRKRKKKKKSSRRHSDEERRRRRHGERDVRSGSRSSSATKRQKAKKHKHKKR